MATRFYLSNAAPTYTPPTRRGAWDATASTLARALTAAKSGTNTTVAQAEASATNLWNVFLGRWISEPLAYGGTISGSLATCIARQESSTNANDYKHVHAYVTVGDSDTVRGTLVANDLGPVEWTTTMTANEDVVTVTPVDVQPGDRIVVEVGYEARNTSTTSFTGTIRYGGTDATDLVDNDTTNASTRSPWVEFSDDLGILRAPLDMNRVPADASTVADAVTRAASASRSGADTIGVSDTLRAAVGRRAADSAGASDALADMRATRHRIIADSAGASDAVEWTLEHAEIGDYQFVAVVEPHVPFGAGQTIAVEKFDPGASATRPQDQDSPVADYRLFGTDLKTPPTWSWDLYTDVYDPGEALAWMENFAEVWDAENTRHTPNAVLALQYRIAGRLRRVYGRPRDYVPIPGDLIQNGKGLVTASFALAENVYYDDEEEVLGPIRILPESRGGGSGWKFPVKFPLKSNPLVTTPPYVPVAQIAGRKKTWVSVDFRGPVVNPWIRLGDLTWGLRGSVAAGETVTITGLPWEMGVRRSDGTYLPGMLDPRSRLSQLRLPPGSYPVSYGGFDPTKASWARLRWRPAYGSM